MKKILLIHGPNLNNLGQRDPEHYGTLTLNDIVNLTTEEASKHGCKVHAFQSNHEGALIDYIQNNAASAVGIIINPGALTHYSYALHDALVDAACPAIEVHLSAIKDREEWRQVSVTAPACVAQIAGKKEKGYVEAVSVLIEKIGN